MAKLIYTSITSLDGYVADEEGNFEWGTPDGEVFAFINDLERQVGTYLYGRRMYETMVYWETAKFPAGRRNLMAEFAEIWRAAEKIVFSTTMQTVSSGRTKLERVLDPEAIRQLKAAVARDVTVNGPNLAAQALRAGLVDECNLFLTPITVGGGKRCLPEDVRLKLELLDEHRFSSGVVYLQYRIEP